MAALIGSHLASHLMPDEIESAKQVLAQQASKAPCEEDIPLQRKAMRECYPLIRADINSSDPAHSAKEIKQMWPSLFKKEHLLDHFHRLTGVRLDGKLSNVPNDVVLLLTSFFRSNTGNDAILEWTLKISQAEMSLGKSDDGRVGLIPLIVTYFKDDLNQMIQVHEASTEMTADFLDNLPVCPLVVALALLMAQATVGST